MISLRTEATEAKYTREKGDPKICPLCKGIEEVVENHKYWRIVKNKYPYDNAFSVSHMVVCLRHVETEAQLTDIERIELKMIKKIALRGLTYDMWIENAIPRRSVLPHLHYHLLQF